MQSLSSSSKDERGKAAGWQAYLSRLLLAAFMLTALIVGALLVPSVAHARAVSSVSGSPIEITQMTMIDSQHGWAFGPYKQHLYTTSHGPEHWIDVTPSFLIQNPTSYITASFFLDATHGYIGLLLGTQSWLLSTQDGGHTWQTTSFDLPDTDYFPIFQVNFIDAQHGWLAINKGQVQPGQFWILLQRTSDGGKTWQTMVDTSQNPASLPTPYSLSAKFTFTDPQHGWVTGISLNGDVYLYSTHDGGKTWSQSNIAPVKGFKEVNFTQSDGPFWQNRQNGTLLVRFDADSDNDISHLATYQTYDGGKSWILGPSSPISTATLFTFNNGRDGWSFGFNGQDKYAILHTRTGGLDWQNFQPTGLIPAQAYMQVLVSLQFMNPTTGWLIIQDGEGTNHLFQTNTGGRSWIELQPVTD